MTREQHSGLRLGQDENEFMQFVEAHERQWGTQPYRGRPSLRELLDAYIVAVWRVEKEERPVLSLHKDYRELDLYFHRLLFRPAKETKHPRKLIRVYQNQQRMVAKNLQITFGPVERG